MAQHWSGTRSGWNQRGGSIRDDIRHTREQLERAYPDSLYWRTEANVVQQKLADYLGTENYRLWAEMTWPGASIDECSWQSIYDTSLEAWNVKEHIFEMLECTCTPISQPCRVCQAMARLSNSSVAES